MNDDYATMSDEQLIELYHEYDVLEQTNDLLQYVMKIKINSAYGLLSMDINAFSHGQGFSAATTTGGRIFNRWASWNVSGLVDRMLGVESTDYNNIAQIDTDSFYFTISGIVAKKEERLGRKMSRDEAFSFVEAFLPKYIYPTIQKSIDDVAFALNVRMPEVMVMEQETIAEKFISVADKRYFCRGLKQNKVSNAIKPYFKITGLSLIGKSTPPFCKEKLEPVLDLVLDSDSKDIVAYINNIRKDFEQQPIQSISVIKGVSSINYDKVSFKTVRNGKSLTAPIHSRGAIIHNNIVSERKLNLPTIVGGDKVYYTYLKLPNPIMSDVISYNDPRFMDLSGLSAYVDYNTLFEKNFKKNIELITEPIGWSLDEYQGAIDDWC